VADELRSWEKALGLHRVSHAAQEVRGGPVLPKAGSPRRDQQEKNIGGCVTSR